MDRSCVELPLECFSHRRGLLRVLTRFVASLPLFVSSGPGSVAGRKQGLASSGPGESHIDDCIRRLDAAARHTLCGCDLRRVNAILKTCHGCSDQRPSGTGKTIVGHCILELLLAKNRTSALTHASPDLGVSRLPEYQTVRRAQQNAVGALPLCRQVSLTDEGGQGLRGEASERDS